MSTLIANLRNKPETVIFSLAVTYYRNGERAVTNLFTGKSAREAMQSALDEATSEYGRQYTSATVEASLVCRKCNGLGTIPGRRPRGSCSAPARRCPTCKGVGSDATI